MTFFSQHNFKLLNTYHGFFKDDENKMFDFGKNGATLISENTTDSIKGNVIKLGFKYNK